MAGSRARRLRRQKRQQGHQGQHHQEDQLEESTTYSELLATTIPANSNQNADKVAQTLGIVQNGGKSSAGLSRQSLIAKQFPALLQVPYATSRQKMLTTKPMRNSRPN
ncbi:hypothetical protein INS49_003905 [Diaporthe citri]|uniref:uncharacterized protein n=1 Tax=Diaporthe citri TaxID=83186 RepID=UPI001C7ED9D2|nr:uncharacterized protein INS49_003905 [Diaporthe citri]KAG6354824.1 hypothetical protein INS49_003905 [Diaporthe citri]